MVWRFRYEGPIRLDERDVHDRDVVAFVIDRSRLDEATFGPLEDLDGRRTSNHVFVPDDEFVVTIERRQPEEDDEPIWYQDADEAAEERKQMGLHG